MNLVSKNVIDETELIDLAKEFSKSLKPGNIIVLKGELGAGKTTFVKGIAKGLGIEKNISSPTFNIIKEYDNILCHIDAYRVMDEDIGIEHYAISKFIICIEWYSNIEDYIPYVDYFIDIEYLLNGRQVRIKKEK